MTARPLHAVSRLAVERARSRMPGFAPDSVEVVELVRGETYIVVRTAPAGVVVLDVRGRLVRGRPRLTAIAGHVHAVKIVRTALAQARLEHRRKQVEQSLAVLERLHDRVGDGSVGDGVGAVVAELAVLGERLDLVAMELRRQRALPPTARTLRRAIALLNEAGAADRRVVRAVRRLAAEITRLHPAPRAGSPPAIAALRRWLVGRLESVDLPLCYPELDEPEGRRFVEAFVVAARS